MRIEAIPIPNLGSFILETIKIERFSFNYLRIKMLFTNTISQGILISSVVNFVVSEI